MENLKHIFDTWDFGSDKKLADSLKKLVIEGKKMATTGLYREGKILPKIGDFGAIKDYDGKVFCTIEYTSVQIVPFTQVTFDFAQKEGEGDKNLESWRESHRDFFKREYGSFNDDQKVVCILFKVSNLT